MSVICVLTIGSYYLCIILKFATIKHNFQSRVIFTCLSNRPRQNILFNTMVEIESMTRYVSPINPAIFPLLAVVLLGIGIFFTAWFFVYEVTSTKFTRDMFKELLISLVAAIFSGFGVLFLLLWVGIYV
ncbi:transmembrane protein 258 [Osmia bicornis bicornis]|uniref:transmembrane protein 258 n=2 Tax=Anthophila TaxID=3042114 RepID=UPI0010F8BC2B|nr:transmembrane protein 258 [Osmia bicornis bicornis]